MEMDPTELPDDAGAEPAENGDAGEADTEEAGVEPDPEEAA